MWATLLEVENPACAWCRAVTTGASRVDLRIHAHVPVGDGTVWEDVEMLGPHWPEALERARVGGALVGDAQVLESSADHARVRVRAPQCALAAAIAASGALPDMPFEARGGSDRLFLVAERERTARFVEELRARGMRVEILQSRPYRPHDALTPRQRELMERAIEQGYYEVPRRVTLTRLAARLGLARSTLSETLARAEQRVLSERRATRP